MTAALAPTRFGRVDEESQGEQIRARRVKLGMDVSALARLAGVDRGRLGRFEVGKESPSDTWVGRVVKALDDFEFETGHAPEKDEPAVVRFIVENVYGAKALVVEVPPENMDELEQAVDRIMRNLRGDGNGENGGP